MTIYLRSVGSILAQMFLGVRPTPCCQGCGFKARGPRHLAQHLQRHCRFDHAGDTPLPGCVCHPAYHDLGAHAPDRTRP